jgi:hypothetical protein
VEQLLVLQAGRMKLAFLQRVQFVAEPLQEAQPDEQGEQIEVEAK